MARLETSRLSGLLIKADGLDCNFRLRLISLPVPMDLVLRGDLRVGPSSRTRRRKKLRIEMGGQMANVDSDLQIDWTACELIERVPGEVSGRPVVKGTCILPDAIANSYELGDSVREIHEGFPTLSIEQITRLIEFADTSDNSCAREGAARRKP
jgi:uncharacterized protein (DUF433 family)